MMKTYQMMGVDHLPAARRAPCHLPPDMGSTEPAQVAPIKPGAPTRRHSCQQLGICQCDGFECVDTTDDQPITAPHDGAMYWGVVIFVATLTCGVVGGVAGVLYSTFGG